MWGLENPHSVKENETSSAIVNLSCAVAHK
jgi:hypothetical protein